MTLINYYSVTHFLIWFLAGRYSRISWLTFLIFSLGWEVLELILPFEFAMETALNKIGDVLVNIIGFIMGTHFRKSLPKDS